MPALKDPKLEAFAQALLRAIANGLPRSKAADEAGKAAGYGGSSRAANARKRANRADVKARMIELAAPKQAEAEAALTVDLEEAERRLGRIMSADIDLSAVKAADVIAAARQLAAMRGWNAPTNVNLTKNDATDWTTAELVAFIADASTRLERSEAEDRSEGDPDRVH